MSSKPSKNILASGIEPLILAIRGQKVILDADLARLYGVTTRRLNEQVKRNGARFPDDFMFQLTLGERSHLVTDVERFAKLKHSKALPNVFTEHGAIMAAGVLNSQRAVEASIFVVRAFVKLRELLSAHKELAQKLGELERKLGDHDEAISALMRTIRQLMEAPPAKTKPRIGFR